jgi:hypothetical protein
MGRNRKLLILVLLLVAIGTGALLIYHRAEQPPGAVRLLPEGDRLIYVNLRPVRWWDLNKSKPVELESDYRAFVEQTGIQFERDLDEVAMSRTDTPDGRDVESAEVFSGRFDVARLRDYLQKISSPPETYRNHVIYSVANEGHMVRVCILDSTRVAVTNMSASDPMHGIIDGLYQSPRGPALLEAHYRDVPLTSLAWMIDRIPANSGGPQLPGGLTFSFLENTIVVASLRYSGNALFQADVFTASEADAKQVAESAGGFLGMYRTVAKSVGAKGPDPDVKAALDSIRVEQKGNVATFTATFSENFLKKIASGVQPEGLAGASSGTPAPVAAPVPTLSPLPKPRRKQQSPPFATCSATPAEVPAGEAVSASVVARNFDPQHDLMYEWTTNGGRIQGQGKKVTIDTNGIAEGQTYTVSVHIRDSKDEKATASCVAGFEAKKR